MNENNQDIFETNLSQEAAEPEGPTVVKTDSDAKDGQNKCPKCGATDISLNGKTGKLRCNFCRHEFDPIKMDEMDKDLSKLEGEFIGSGAQDIIADTDDMVTFKCSSCGAEVVVDTATSLQARCHWCRNTLSVNQQIPNGAIPDTVLPFSISRDVAKAEIESFVGKRKFFANPTFKEEFVSDNVMGVYLPYMIVDANTHANLQGQGEHLVRQYTEGSGDNKKTYYDADLYDVEREFDLEVQGLTIESSEDKLNVDAKEKTNDIINSIMPFDTENCVKWDANYIKGFTSEKRDTNVDQLQDLVGEQTKDIARFAANDTLGKYDRGVRWDVENLEVKGKQWRSAYLPVWLYSYQQKKGNKSLLHYVAVNARTKETMGSVPIHMPKLLLVSALVQLIGIILAVLLVFLRDDNWPLIFLLSGVLYYSFMYFRYRNRGVRHSHETETKTKMSNLREVDNFVKHRKRLSNAKMSGANNERVGAMSASTDITSKMADMAKDTLKDQLKGRL